MKEFFDTSVLIASFWRGHPDHEASLKLVAAAHKRKSACALHTLAEGLSMTALPVKQVIPPDQALLFVHEVRGTIQTALKGSLERLGLVRETNAANFAGGSTLGIRNKLFRNDAVTGPR